MTEELEIQQQDYAESNISFKEMISQENKMLKFFPKLIQDLIKEKFPVQFKIEEGFFIVGDFYKSHELKLVLDDDDKLIAFDKEGNKGVVSSIEEIVNLNFYWWISSQTRQGYPQLTRHWTEQFLKRKWLKIVRVYTPDLEAFESFNKKSIEIKETFEKNQEDLELENQLKEIKKDEVNSDLKVDDEDDNEEFNL